MDNQETREVTTTYADGSTVTMTIDRKTGALLDYNATPPPPRNTDEGLQELKSRIASIESSLSDVKKADSGELEKRLGTLEDAVNKSNEQVTTLKEQVSQIGTPKAETSQIDDILDRRLDALREDIKNTYLYQIFEVGRLANQIGERVSTLESQFESIIARLEALEQK